MATRNEINDLVRTMLANGTQKQIGLIDPPSSEPVMPYAVLLPMIVSEGGSDMEDIDRELDMIFNVIVVGKDARQAGAMGSSVHAVMTAKVGSNYVHPLVIPGLGVMWRLCDSRGAMMRQGSLFQSTDAYRIRVGP